MSVRPLAPGDVVLVVFPLTDLSGSKLRPAIFLTSSRGDDVILAFVTSQLHAPDPVVDVILDPADPEFVASGLKVASLIRLDKITTLHRSLIQRRIDRLGLRTQEQLRAALRHVFDL